MDRLAEVVRDADRQDDDIISAVRRASNEMSAHFQAEDRPRSRPSEWHATCDRWLAEVEAIQEIIANRPIANPRYALATRAHLSRMDRHLRWA